MDIKSIDKRESLNFNYSKELTDISKINVSIEEDKHLNNGDKEELNTAIKKLNKFLEDEDTHAEYSVHDTMNRIMVKIICDKTDEVIMELPSEKIIDAVAMMCKIAGVLIDKKA